MHSIAAASILAKVTRDAVMDEMDAKYPGNVFVCLSDCLCVWMFLSRLVFSPLASVLLFSLGICFVLCPSSQFSLSFIGLIAASISLFSYSLLSMHYRVRVCAAQGVRSASAHGSHPKARALRHSPQVLPADSRHAGLEQTQEARGRGDEAEEEGAGQAEETGDAAAKEGGGATEAR